MPATPAWPPANLPRLYVEERLSDGQLLTLEGPKANYLSAVLRLTAGALVKLFDDMTGEYLAEITEAGKKRVTVRVGRHIRPREVAPDLWLLFAPIKRGRIDWIAEKATELGVARLVPVITHRTIVDRLNPERLFAHMVEAAEQCERTALPEFGEPQKLAALLKTWPENRMLLFADENGGEPMLEAVSHSPAAILIGPEGGFTQEERAAIRALAGAKPVSLGPRILRADTAAVAAVALWMAAVGDWGRHAAR
ncbi:MAG: 16S rRNA (uracil(1498)-N(3))-methyltransferase [Pseudomonadota bacterium]|nr:16S rRNA (uracil(1498)-N(3))-methyltransferase [Pseudomonadota bacterium]